MAITSAQYFFIDQPSFSWKSCASACLLHIVPLALLGNAVVERAEYSMAAGASVQVQLIASAPTSAAIHQPAAISAAQVEDVTQFEEVRQVEAKPVLIKPVLIKPVLIKKDEFVLPQKEKKQKPKALPKVQRVPVAQPNPQPPINPQTANQQIADLQPRLTAISGSQGAGAPGGSDGFAGAAGAKVGVNIDAAYLRNPPPAYPSASRRSREEGLVMLLVTIDPNGSVADLSVKSSSGYSRLDEAAVKAVKRWTFKATRVAGIPSADTVEVPIRFALRS